MGKFWTFFIFLLFIAPAYGQKDKAHVSTVQTKPEAYRNEILAEDQRFILSIFRGGSKKDKLVGEHFLLDRLPNPFDIKLGMSSKDVFAVMGRATNSDASSIGIFLRHSELSPLERARKNYSLDDSPGNSLKCLATWELVTIDKKNNAYAFLYVDVIFAKSWRTLKQEEKSKSVVANPFIRGQDSGWNVCYYYIKKWTEEIPGPPVKKEKRTVIGTTKP